MAGPRRRGALVLRSDRRRIRGSGFARRFRGHHDRADPVDGILCQPGLARGIGRRGGAARAAARAHRDLSAFADARNQGSPMRRMSVTNLTALALGLAFLYVPIAILVVYSFNASRLVTVWGGWSIRWYVELMQDRAMIDAALASLGIAFASALLATVLGTMAAVVLTKLRFHGRLPFAAMIYAPLVMPEVITGLSLLLLFVAVDLDRGFSTVIMAHTTLTMCFVTVI